MLGTRPATSTSSSRRRYGWRTMLFQVSVMWCSKRTTDSNPSSLRISAQSSMVRLFTELQKLKPMSGQVPSRREKSRAVRSVHRMA